MKYQRPLLGKLITRIHEPRKFIQVIAGPRQVGKTTMAISLKDQLRGLVEYHSADDAAGSGIVWVDQIWESLRIQMTLGRHAGAVLIIDEIQRIPNWSHVIKKNWDRDTRDERDIKLVLLGSSRLLLMDGLSESLMGRFELNHAGHWSFAEMEKAFGFSLEEFLWFGAYPGAAGLANDEPRFKEYIRNSIAEPTMTRDILMTTRIDKPALLRQLFEIGVLYSTQIVSFNKMLGQLQDAGNTTTLSKYLRLLEQSGLLSGLDKFCGSAIRTKGTIPKFQVHNAALLSALKHDTFADAFKDPAEWGPVVENSVGAYLIDQVSQNPHASLHYWRDGNFEIDYVLVWGQQIVGIEIKSGGQGLPGGAEGKFKERFPQSKVILVGKHGIPCEVFLKTSLGELLAAI